MPTLNIGGKKVKVDDSFLKLSPEQQNATVDEIAKKLDAGSAAPSAPAPGSREYADWAAAEARAGHALPQVSPPPPNNGGLTAAVAAIPATMQGITGSIPGLNQAADALVAGGQSVGDMFTGQPVDFGAHYNAIQDRRGQIANAAPIAQTMGGIGGTMALTGGLGALPGGAEALGLSGGFGKQVINSALSTAGYEGLQGLAKGRTGAALLADEGIGAASGGLGSVVGQGLNKLGQTVADKLTGVAQRSMSKAATTNAPTADELKAASRAMFDAVDNAGVTVSTDKFTNLVADLAGQARLDHIDETLDPKSFGVYRQLIGILGEAQSGARPLTLSDLHTVRQIAQKAAMSTEGRDAMFSNRIVSELDKFITKPGALSAGGKEAGNNLLGAISTWGRARRVGLIEDALYKAQNQASGVENGLRTQFRQLLQNPKTRALFNPAELKALEDVARGTTLSNAVKLLGKFGFGPNNMLGGSIGATLGGALGGIPGAVATAAVGAGSRKISENMTKNAAELAAKVIATPNVPIAQQLPNLLAGPSASAGLLIRAAIPAMGGR